MGKRNGSKRQGCYQGPDPQGPGQVQGHDPQGPGQGQGPDPKDQTPRTRTRTTARQILLIAHFNVSNVQW